VRARSEGECSAERSGGVSRSEEAVGVLLLVDAGLLEEREAWKEDVVEVWEPELEASEARDGKASGSTRGSLASLEHHALGVSAAASARGSVGDDGGGALRVVARGAEGATEGASAEVEASLAPGVGGHSGESRDQLLVVLIALRRSESRARRARLGLRERARLEGASPRGSGRGLVRGEQAKVGEESERVERETVVEDDSGRRICRLSTAGRVLEVEEAIGLGVEAKEGGRGVAVGLVGEAGQAEQLAEEAEESTVERPVKVLLPGGRLVSVARVGVLECGGVPEVEVPVRVVAGVDGVGDVEQGEEGVDRVPVSEPVAVGEEGVDLGALGVGRTLEDGSSIGGDASLSLWVQLVAIGLHPGGEVFEGSGPGGALPWASFGASVREEVSALALPDGATSEAIEGPASSDQSLKSEVRADLLDAVAGSQEGGRRGVLFGEAGRESRRGGERAWRGGGRGVNLGLRAAVRSKDRSGLVRAPCDSVNHA
jgi:hypothetical protein